MSELQAVINPNVFREEGFLFDYPVKGASPWPFMGYTSEMVNMALRNDDPAAFIYFMKRAGLDKNARTFDDLTMETYCERRKAKKCLRVLNQLGSHS